MKYKSAQATLDPERTCERGKRASVAAFWMTSARVTSERPARDGAECCAVTTLACYACRVEECTVLTVRDEQSRVARSFDKTLAKHKTTPPTDSRRRETEDAAMVYCLNPHPHELTRVGAHHDVRII